MDIKVILIDSKLIYCLCAHVHWLEGSFLEQFSPGLILESKDQNSSC